MRVRFLACLLAVAASGSFPTPARAHEREYYFDRLDDSHGLVQNTIRVVTQTRDGMLWVVTQGGLHRYDGYQFDLFEHTADGVTSLPDSPITAVAEDDTGNLWVASSANGVSRLDPIGRVFTSFSLPEDAPQRYEREAVQALAFDADHRLWIGNRDGLEWLDPTTGKRERVGAESANEAMGAVSALHLASNGTLWIATGKGLSRIARNSTRVEAVAREVVTDVRSLIETRDQSIHVGGSLGLHRIDPNAGTVEWLWRNPGTLPVTAISEDHAGRMWLAIRGEGLVAFDPRSKQDKWLRASEEMPEDLPQREINTLFVDRSGLLWVGGDSLGLARVDPDGATFRFILDSEASREHPSTNNIRALLEDADGSLWIGTDGDGLKRYDRKSQRFSYHDSAMETAFVADSSVPWVVEALDMDAQGKLWFASNHGVGKLDPSTGVVTALHPPQTLAANGVGSAVRRCIVVARDGSIWTGGWTNGVARFQPGSGQWQDWVHREGDAESLTDNRVLAMHEDSAGRIWVGTLDGLNVIDPVTGKVRTMRHERNNPRSLSSGVIRSIHESADGSFWIGTLSGLNRLKAFNEDVPSFERVLRHDGLPDATIYGILEDAMGQLWLSSNRGIASYDPVSGLVRAFSLRDGLQGLEFNGGAQLALRSGELAFGGLNGINLFSPSTVAASRFVPPVVITSARIGAGESFRLRPGEPIRLGQADRVMHLDFAALDYKAPELNRYRYILEGFDETWIDAGARRQVTYTNLDPGTYRFRVHASGNGGNWNDDGAIVDIEVQPAWWNSWPMHGVYALVILLSVLALWLSMRHKRIAQLSHARELQEREGRLRLALWGSGDEFWDLDMDSGVLTRLGATRASGGRREERHLVYDWVRDNIHPDDQRAIAQRLDDHLNKKVPIFESEQRIRAGHGAWIWVIVRGKVVERNEQGQPLRICGTARNITATRDADRERRIAQEVIASMREGVSVCDLDFRFVAVNPAFTRITGWQEYEVIGQSAALLNCAQHSPEYYQVLRETILRDGFWRGELWQRRKDGEEFLCWLQSSEVRDARGQRTHFIGVLTDITERKRNEQELRYLANYDTLTGLPNRALLSERLGHAVIRARRGGRKVAVLFLDLDRFKHVNDSMGHAAGDRMLKAAGSRLRDNIRDADTVARIGGDEFTVILEELANVAEAERVAQKLISAFEKPLELSDRQDVVISPSIGISIYPDHAQTPTDLLKFADTAMYQAKERGRKTWMVYTETMDAAARMRATLVGALRKAIDRGELSLVYQPKLSLLDQRITGVETLLRWRSEELGDIPPTTFIPVAEESGLIIEIGDWVLVQACQQLARWQRDGLRDISISVNLSVMQLQRSDLIQRLCDILAENDLAPSQLELELTESVVMANAEQSINTLRQLKAVGVTLSIDDFGTGYSSLSYLRRLPIDTLKIDKEFVGDITTDPDDEAITATVITMAHSLGLNVIAEGVETAEQVEYLREQGCDEVQGHWLSRPMPPESCLEFLRERARLRRAALGDARR